MQHNTQHRQCQFAVLPEDKLKCSNIMNKTEKNDNYKMSGANPAHRMGMRSDRRRLEHVWIFKLSRKKRLSES